MITGVNESKTLINHVSCECKCINLTEENVIQIEIGIKIDLMWV